ncbi:MAG: hypothetical protein KDD22_05320 [Bdellovibrionales bacterium]|nr:hypothetical protein [Bdellovibrionales bacterium]
MKTRISDLIQVGSIVRAAYLMRTGRKPGLDEVTPEQFRKRIKITDLASQLMNQLETGTYRTQPLLRSYIPKTNGDLREISIPIVQDGVIQKALVNGLTPITESRFLENSFGFRPKRNVICAVREASRLIREGYKVCYSLDLETFFPNINRELLRRYLREHYGLAEDTRKLINSFITAKVIGHKAKSTKGIPAGIPLAPLLANIYLHPLDQELQELGVPFIRYADDITLFFRSKEECIYQTRFWDDCEQRFGIVVNRQKTNIYAEGPRPVLGFNIDEYGGITVSRAVIDKIERSLIGLLAKSHLSLSKKVMQIRQRLSFYMHYYKEIQNFDEFKGELERIQDKLIGEISCRHSKMEIAQKLELEIDRIDEYEFIDEIDFLKEETKPKIFDSL